MSTETWRGKFYIIDTRQIVGNCAMFWGKDRRGYVCDLDQAGEYSEADAKGQQRERDTDVAIPCETARALVCAHVRVDSPGWRVAKEKALAAPSPPAPGSAVGE